MNPATNPEGDPMKTATASATVAAVAAEIQRQKARGAWVCLVGVLEALAGSFDVATGARFDPAVVRHAFVCLSLAGLV
jgi:hypothetical protein